MGWSSDFSHKKGRVGKGKGFSSSHFPWDDERTLNEMQMWLVKLSVKLFYQLSFISKLGKVLLTDSIEKKLRILTSNNLKRNI